MKLPRWIGRRYDRARSYLAKTDCLFWHYMAFRIALYGAVRVLCALVLTSAGLRGAAVEVASVVVAAVVAARREKPFPAWMDPAWSVRLMSAFSVAACAAYCLSRRFNADSVVSAVLVCGVVLSTHSGAVRRSKDLALASVLEG